MEKINTYKNFENNINEIDLLRWFRFNRNNFCCKIKIKKINKRIIKIKKKISFLKVIANYYDEKIFKKYDFLYTWNDLSNMIAQKL